MRRRCRKMHKKHGTLSNKKKKKKEIVDMYACINIKYYEYEAYSSRLNYTCNLCVHVRWVPREIKNN